MFDQVFSLQRGDGCDLDGRHGVDLGFAGFLATATDCSMLGQEMAEAPGRLHRPGQVAGEVADRPALAVGWSLPVLRFECLQAIDESRVFDAAHGHGFGPGQWFS